MDSHFSSSFVYEGRHILVDWFDVVSKDAIPDMPWSQVYAIGSLNGLVPLVTNIKNEKSYNLPGGSVEPGETLDQTLCRELIEECNMRVLDWQPLGYQLLTEPDGKKVYQFRVYATLEKIGEFTHDPGGGVVKNTLVALNEVNQKINYGDVGERLIRLAAKHFAH